MAPMLRRVTPLFAVLAEAALGAAPMPSALVLATESTNLPLLLVAESEAPLEGSAAVSQQPKAKPVPASTHCVVAITIQYMLVYTAVALVRTAADIFSVRYENLPLHEVLQTACLTVGYAPMLAALFLGCQMRVTLPAPGSGQQPVYVQDALRCCTYSMLLMTLCVCIIPIFTGKVVGFNPHTGEREEDAADFGSPRVAAAFTAAKGVAMFGLYAGAFVVVYDAVAFGPPAGTGPGGVPPVSPPAFRCVMILSCAYFLVHAGIQICRSVEEWRSSQVPKMRACVEAAANAMNFAPMFAILFLAARMRALQIDPVNGVLQVWAQNSFYVCTYAVAMQTVLCVAVPLVMRGVPKKGGAEGEMEYTVGSRILGSVLSVGKYFLLLCMYGGLTCLAVSIFVMEHPAGPHFTPPVSGTMQCVLNLIVQYFVVYLMLSIVATAKELTGLEWPLLSQTMENAKATVALCPMLAVLFLWTRSAPLGWVQDGMYLAAGSLFAQLLACFLVPLAAGRPAACDPDGTPKWEPAYPTATYAALALKWATFFCLYGGVAAVVVSIYGLAPEGAEGLGNLAGALAGARPAKPVNGTAR